MRFAHLNYLGFIVLIFLSVILFYAWSLKQKKKALKAFADKELLPELLAYVDIRKQSLKIFFILSAILLGLIALMRPQWGFDWVQVKRRGLDILIAVDTSKSMLAEDVKPNRIERTKLALKDMVRQFQGDRIGLIAFAGDAFLQCPLTVDYNGFLLSLESLNTDTIPSPGTSLSRAISEALKSYEGGLNKYKALIIITDGEDHEGSPLKEAGEAAKQGVQVFCIGIGTKEGELIPVTEANGAKSFLKDEGGNVVKSRLNEKLLGEIALKTEGMYVRSTAREFGLDYIYKERLSKMEKRELEGKMAKDYKEKFQVLLVFVLILLTAELFIEEKKDVL